VTKLQVFWMMCLALVFIIVDIFCNNFLATVYARASNLEAFVFFVAFGALQVIFAPFQSAASDVYGRKSGLIISLFFSLASLILMYLFKGLTGFLAILVIATLFKGVAGNTLPMSLALIADTRHQNYRLLFACSTGAYALAYLVLAKLEDLHLTALDEQFNFYLILAVLTCLIIGIAFLKNQLPEANNLAFSSVMKKEKKLIEKDLINPFKRRTLSAFFLWETSLYVILLSQIEFHINRINHIADWMMYGYLIGVLLLIILYRLKGYCSNFGQPPLLGLRCPLSYSALPFIEEPPGRN
jgi:Major Facilitator Superfamily.